MGPAQVALLGQPHPAGGSVADEVGVLFVDVEGLLLLSLHELLLLFLPLPPLLQLGSLAHIESGLELSPHQPQSLWLLLILLDVHQQLHRLVDYPLGLILDVGVEPPARIGDGVDLIVVGLDQVQVEGRIEESPHLLLLGDGLDGDGGVQGPDINCVLFLVQKEDGGRLVLLVLLVEFGQLVATLAGHEQDVVGPDNGHQSVLALYKDKVPDAFPEVAFPDVPDALGALLVLLPGAGDRVLVEPEAHEVPVLEADVAPFIFETHPDAVDFGGGLLADEVAGGLELLDVGGQVEPEYFCLLSEAEQEVLLAEVDEAFDVAGVGFALADQFVLVDVHEVDLASAGADDERVPLALVAEGSDGGVRVYLPDGQALPVVELPVEVLLEDGHLPVVGSAEDLLLPTHFLDKHADHVGLVLVELLHQHPVLQLAEKQVALRVADDPDLGDQEGVEGSDLCAALVAEGVADAAGEQAPCDEVVLDGTVEGEVVGVVAEAEGSRVEDHVGVDVDVLEGRDGQPPEEVAEGLGGGNHGDGFGAVVVLVDGEGADECELADFADADVGVCVEGDEEVGVGDDVELDEVDVADDLVDEGLDVGVPDADRVVEGGSEEEDESLVEGHARDGPGVLLVLELARLRNGVPQDQPSVVAPRRQELQLRHHYHRRNHLTVPLCLAQLPLRVRLHHPLSDHRTLPAAVQYLVHVVPAHRVHLLRKLMLHLLVLVLRLLGQSRHIRRNVPAADYEVGAAGDEHVVLAVVDVDHVKQDVLVLSHHQFLLEQFLLAGLGAFGNRGLDGEGLLAEDEGLEAGGGAVQIEEEHLAALLGEEGYFGVETDHLLDGAAVLREGAVEAHWLHQGGAARLLVAQSLEVEALLNEHGIELAPGNGALVGAVGLLEQPRQTLSDLDVTVLEFPLPGLEVPQSLRDELVPTHFVLLLLEGVFEEAQDVLVDVDRQVGGQPVQFPVDLAQRRPRRVDGCEAGLLRQFDVVHGQLQQFQGPYGTMEVHDGIWINRRRAW